MELVEDKNVETMAALYCGNQSHQNVPIHLFAEFNIDLNAAPETDVNGDDGYDNSDPSNHEVDVWNLIQCIVIHNDPGAHMSLIDPNTALAAEFLNYPDILPGHWLAIDSELEELFMGQKFKIKEEYVFAIKWLTKGCNWWGWVAVMQEFMSEIVIELKAQPYYDSDDQLQPGKRIFL
ncbi:hypothetical protein GOBAR_AA01051 [Gossypium barbadense]|uniref:Uncharacterized protein n=1 Tax=Gossypium barbadense TaxID=3634 RepID=A0A2P5YV88_GOSBA|nr:hypothetical protein GOBAR_AA01051 [Gossypium barbadense]